MDDQLGRPMLLFLIACADYTFVPTDTAPVYVDQVVDVWQFQPTNTPTDVVFVLDASGSMMDNWDTYDVQFPQIVASLQLINSDWRATMISADMSLGDPVVWAYPPDAATTLPMESDYIRQHGLGGDEAGLMAAFLFSQSGQLRVDADTYYIFISDEADSSGLDTNVWTTFMNQTKVYPYISYSGAIVTISEICTWLEPDPALRYSAVSSIAIDLCGSETWADVLNPILSRHSMLPPAYHLSEPADPSTIQVYLDGQETTAWTYTPTSQVLQLTIIPRVSAPVIVTYFQE